MYVARRERAKGFFPPMARTAVFWNATNPRYQEMIQKTEDLSPDFKNDVMNFMGKFKNDTPETEDIPMINAYIEKQKKVQNAIYLYNYNRHMDSTKGYLKDTLMNINKNIDEWSSTHMEDLLFLKNELLSTNVLRKLFLPQEFYEYNLDAASPRLMFILALVMGVVGFMFLFVLFWLILASIALNACINSGNAPQGLNIYVNPSADPMTCSSIAQQCMIPNFMTSLSVAD